MIKMSDTFECCVRRVEVVGRPDNLSVTCPELKVIEVRKVNLVNTVRMAGASHTKCVEQHRHVASVGKGARQ